MGEIKEELRQAQRPRSGATAAPGTADPGTAYFEIPRTRDGVWAARAVLTDASGPTARAYQQIAVRIRSKLDAMGARIIAITSAAPQEGKTVTSCNLALTLGFAAGEKRVALADFDLRRPGVAAAIGLSAESGIEEFLDGRAQLDQVRIRTSVPALDAFPVRKPQSDPVEMLARSLRAGSIDKLATGYQVVVIDTPPVLSAPEVAMILRHVDACLIVVRVGTTRLAELVEAVNLLPREKLAGIVLNGARSTASARRYVDYYEPAEAAEGDGEGPTDPSY